MSAHLALTLAELSARHPAIALMIADLGGEPGGAITLRDWLTGLRRGRAGDGEIDPAAIGADIALLLDQAEAERRAAARPIGSVTVLPGHDKDGKPERFDLTMTAGEVLCVVGPTGSGKSRLLADIECLARGDTPSGRRVLIDGAPPALDPRIGGGRRLVAQLAQNMNFVVDLGVREFLEMHAESRLTDDPARRAAEVIDCANRLAGEPFSGETSVTRLSGGQSRALMIADVALLSASPVVLIDEIENAGIDRAQALELLVSRDKIVLISTHDPILALLGGRRIVVANGAVTDVVVTSDAERANLQVLERVDRRLADLRRRLRSGGRIDEPLDPTTWLG